MNVTIIASDEFYFLNLCIVSVRIHYTMDTTVFSDFSSSSPSFYLWENASRWITLLSFGRSGDIDGKGFGRAMKSVWYRRRIENTQKGGGDKERVP